MRSILTVTALSLVLMSCHSSEHKITYKVVGSDSWAKDHPDLGGQVAKIRLRNKSGGDDESKAFLPWSQDDTVTDGDLIYFTAQLDQRDETYIACQIFLDGKLVRESHSSGEFAVADCAGRV